MPDYLGRLFSLEGRTALTRHWCVCVNTLRPGSAATTMTASVLAGPGRAAGLAARTMVGRIGVAADFAGMAVFLGSASSGYITGQTVCIDGGFSVH